MKKIDILIMDGNNEWQYLPEQIELWLARNRRSTNVGSEMKAQDTCSFLKTNFPSDTFAYAYSGGFPVEYPR